MKYTRKNEIKKKHLARKIPFQKRHTKIKRKKPKKKSQKKNTQRNIQKGGWPPKGKWNPNFKRTSQGFVQQIADDTHKNPRFELDVDFETPDAGYFDLVNNNVAEALKVSLNYATSNGKTINDILWQTDPFTLFDKNRIIITVKLFGINNTTRDYTKKGMTWDEIGCDAYGPTNLGIDQLKIKGVPCSRGNTERRIFFKIPGNLFHYILALNQGEIKIENHILFIHIAHYMFKKDDGSHFLVHIHNEDVPWFHIKAVTGQGAEVNLIRSNNSSRNTGIAPPIYGKELQSVPPKLFESSTSGINNTMYSIVGDTLKFNRQPNIKHSIPRVVLARGMSFNQSELPYIMDNKGQFNMDIWFKRLSKNNSETFWSLFPRVACSYSTGSHGSQTDDETVAEEINRAGKICVVVLAYFDFTGNSSTDFAGEFLTPSIIFETDNKNNDPIGGRPSNSRAHVDDYANIANLIGISPKKLNVSGNSTFTAGELLCSTLNKKKIFDPNNVGGYYVPHNLAQFVLCSETYQYVAHLEAYVYNSYNGNNFKAVFPIQSKQRPMPGKREPWDMENIYDKGNNGNIQSAKKFMTDVYASMFN